MMPKVLIFIKLMIFINNINSVIDISDLVYAIDLDQEFFLIPMNIVFEIIYKRLVKF